MPYYTVSENARRYWAVDYMTISKVVIHSVCFYIQSNQKSRYLHNTI